MFIMQGLTVARAADGGRRRHDRRAGHAMQASTRQRGREADVVGLNLVVCVKLCPC
jgi:hypothetical protein